MAGATSNQVRFSDRFMMALALHRKNAISSLLEIFKNPANSILTILVLAIALALPGIFYMMTSNAKAVAGNWNTSMAMSLYLETSTKEPQARELVADLLENSSYESVDLKTKDQALEEFKANSGYADALEMLDSNPLPMVITIVPSDTEIKPDELARQLEILRKNPLVESAILDMDWVNKYQEILSISEKIASFVSILLAFGVTVIIGNTIRLAILNRREEIQIIKLVGATDGFIRRPFLYTGFWYGIMAGFIAALMISVLSHLVTRSASRLAELYQSQFNVLGLSLEQTLYLVAIGALLGLIGAWLSVRKHLRDIQPN